VAAGLFLFGCTEDLPPGWEGADHVTSLTQHDCGGSPLDEGDSERAMFLPGRNRLEIEYSDAHFRCQQGVEGFYKDAGGTLEVLVQPVDMSPSSVAACDCLYDIDIVIDSLASGSRQAVLSRRWDDINDDNDPVVIDSEPIVIE
jgi:hypothetical protein